MRMIFLAGLLLAAATGSFAQTAEEFYNEGSRKSFKSYGKEGGAAVADEAIVDLDQAIKLKADYHDAYNLRANMKIQTEDFAGAIDDYSKAIQFSSMTAAYYTNRAHAREKNKDVKGALADMKTVIKLTPKESRAYMNRGEIKLNAGDHAGALIDLNKALELKPDFFAILRRRAAVYRALGKNDLAEADEKIYKEESDKFMERLLKR